MPIMTPSTDARTLNAAADFAQTEGQRLAFSTNRPEHIAAFLTDLNRAARVLRRTADGVGEFTREELDAADACFEAVEQATLTVHKGDTSRTAFLHTVEFLRDSLAFLTREVR